MPASLFQSRRRIGLTEGVRWTMLLTATVFFALHFLHLNADFPNHSPWLDRAKYTDEGWYSDAATRHFQRGSWYADGGFNPGVALPVWPLVESLPFWVFGASMAAARACAVLVFGLVCGAAWLLLYWWRDPNIKGQARSLAPELAVVLLNTSPFCFAFFRMAVLEPPLIAIVLLAFVAATRTRKRPAALRPLLVLGVLLPAIVLTKTTGLAVFPAIVWLLWSCTEAVGDASRLRRFLRATAILFATAGSLFIVYTFAITHFHLSADARNVFAANAYHINRHNALAALLNGLRDLHWIGAVLILILVAVVVAVVRPRRNPVVPTLLLWIAGYLAFIVYHGSRQPRYYLPIFVPLLLLLAHVAARPFIGSAASRSRKVLSCATALVLGAVVALEARETLHYVFHPEYTFLNAARQIRTTIDAEPTHSPLLMSASGSDLSLLSGVASIGDLFTLLPPEQLAQRYRPGWMAVYMPLETATRDRVAEKFHLEEAGRFRIMDDAELGTLVLYRLSAASNVEYDKRQDQRLKPTP